jgi:cytochrome b561
VLRNSDRSWGAPAKLLHWTVAALVLAQVALGWAAVSWRLSPTKLDLFVWHKSTGMLILALMIVRLAWRLANPVPALPAGMPRWERRAAAASHAALYLLGFLAPISGWIVSSASGIPFRLFRLVPVPAIVAPDKAMADAAATLHLVLFVALALLLSVHIGAALRHHYLQHGDVLSRMLPGRGAVE